MFKKGQKIVCVDDEDFTGVKRLYLQWPVRNETYTCRECYMGQDEARRDEIVVLVEELINSSGKISGVERGFRYTRFVPLVPDDLETEEIEVEEETDLIGHPDLIPLRKDSSY